MIPRRVPRQFVERLAYESLRHQHAVSHVAGRIRDFMAEVVHILRQVRRRLADRLERDNLQVVPTTLLEKDESTLRPLGDTSLSTATRVYPLRASHEAQSGHFLAACSVRRKQ